MPSRIPNLFAGQYLERAAYRRLDAAWLEAALRTDAVIVPIAAGRNFVRRSGDAVAAWMPASGTLEVGGLEPVFLGMFRERACFAVELPQERLAPDVEALELRAMAWQLPVEEAGVLAYARALMLWRERHRYCGRCGSPARAESAGHVLTCSNEACGHQQFPRIDPAIITLISDRDGEHALLGRQSSWPPKRYSTIAGFVEPGESLEDAVVREVFEETGVHVESVEYHSSQPWPFPSSLMIGFVAYARTREIELHDQELEDARWFSRAEIATGEVVPPMHTSVSYRLIEDWYDSKAEQPLREVLAQR